jgi:hypothetical protein
LAKRLSEKQKLEIAEDFLNKKSIDYLSQKYDFTKLTISRNLKKSLGEEKYKEIVSKQNLLLDSIKQEKVFDNGKQELRNEIREFKSENILNDELTQGKSISLESFVEIAPLDHYFDNEPQKDISSVPLSQINFPSTVFLIVKKEIELETKYLKDYPEWQFLPKDDLDRKTIEIHYDLKTAKRLCSKDQKVIKVPNTDVFRVVSPILLSRGITRLVTDNNLICL